MIVNFKVNATYVAFYARIFGYIQSGFPISNNYDTFLVYLPLSVSMIYFMLWRKFFLGQTSLDCWANHLCLQIP